MRPRLLFHCQHSLGLGHLVRSLALARALAERFEVVLLAGGELPSGLDLPHEVEVVPLPPIGGIDLVSRDRGLTLDAARLQRETLVLRTFRSVRPAVVVVELFPFGRKKFAGELLPLLEAAPRSVCSVRDILVRGRSDQTEHDERAARIANRHLDAVLVHADPRYARLDETFRPRIPLRVPVHYTGFVVPDRPLPDAPAARGGPVVVSAGGGFVGGTLLRAAVDAQPALWRRSRVPMLVVAGPFLADREWAALRAQARAREGLEVVRSVGDLAAELVHARASVSQCGYNTALDLLRSGVPALVVPFAAPGEDEQRRRAERLRRLGAVRVLDPGRLDGGTLAAELDRVLRFDPERLDLDLDGARTSAALLERLVAARSTGAVA